MLTSRLAGGLGTGHGQITWLMQYDLMDIDD